MERTAYHTLVAWKARPHRKPLIIQGARQVGKTWLMREFGARAYEQVAYFNAERSPEIRVIFSRGLQPDRLLEALGMLCGFTIQPGKTLVIIDEIQACPEAITALKYFSEEAPDIAIMAAGSLLGVAIHQGISFPVGKVEFLTLHPLGFHEFLSALGRQDLVSLLQRGDREMISIFHEQYMDLLKKYMLVGGMPEAVTAFIETGRPESAAKVQQDILRAYEQDFSKHAPVAQWPRIRLVWQSILSQLAKENSKFMYSLLRTGARAKEFELAIEWLKDAGLIHKVTRVKKSGVPLDAYADWSDFKIYLNDTGLLSCMAGLSPVILFQDDRLFTEFKGVLTEQFVLQQLVCQGEKLFYWNPDNAQSEVGFVLQRAGGGIPLEVKAAQNVRSRSLSVFQDSYHPMQCIRTSALRYRTQDWMENIPLYGIQQWLIDSKDDADSM